LLVFTVVAAVAFMLAYAFGVGGTDSSLIFLAILTTGAVVRWAQPIVERLKP
jgi:hypothetical protein